MAALADTVAHRPASPERWHTGVQSAPLDPLLDCLVGMARLHGVSTNPASLSAGLPIGPEGLSPDLVHRAAARAGLCTRVATATLDGLLPEMLPVILLLKERRACILLTWTATGEAVLRFPESGDSGEPTDRAALDAEFSGTVVFARPTYPFDIRSSAFEQATSAHWFWSVVRRNWRLYRDSLLAAALINLFALAMPLFSMAVYDRVVPNKAEETLWVLALGVVLMMVFDMVLRTMRSHILDTASQRIDICVSARIMERVLGMRMADKPASVGAFATQLRGFETVRDFVAAASVTTLIDVPFVLIFMGVLVWISPWLAMAPVVCIAIVMGTALLSQRRMQTLVQRSQRAASQRQASLVESLVGLETIKAMRAESRFQRTWEHSTSYVADTASQLKLLSSATLQVAQAMQQLVGVSSIIVGVYLLMDKQISMGAIIAASMVAGRALAPWSQVAGLWMQYQQARSGLASVDQHMQRPAERAPGRTYLQRPKVQGSIEFKDVSFHYPGHSTAALSHVSFTIKAGEKVAVIGRVGSGKSTLQRLILGLYAPSEGSILVDGIDIRQWDPAVLRRAAASVAQDVHLFFGSLKENIALGAPQAADHDILAAAEIAGVSELANAHPQGFDMPISERGDSLSGGQRQAVGIARAVLLDAPMLLLDEPTSAMDAHSEDALKTRLRHFCADKTLLLVTHRNALLDLADRLLVLDQGRVVADGTKAQVVEALQRGRLGGAP